jgi:hypothetical protein
MGGKAKPTKHTAKELAKKVCRAASGHRWQEAPNPKTFVPCLKQAAECIRVAWEQDFEANVNRGGGAAGAAQRKGGQCGFKCYVCLCAQPSEKSLQIHWDAKHDGMTLDIERARQVILQ